MSKGKFPRKSFKSFKKHENNKSKVDREDNKRGNSSTLFKSGAANPTENANEKVGGTGAGSSVYKRKPVYPRSLNIPNENYFVTSSNTRFDELIQTSYPGFVAEDCADYPDSFSSSYKRALQDLDDAGFYQFDLTQPAGLGTKIAKTYVTRCLVGAPGMTYKYLGLRMFAHPWTNGEVGATEATVTIGRLNEQMIRRSQELNEASGKAEYGSSSFNLTLINRCFPPSQTNHIVLKKEPLFERDLCAVSWHADSCLDHYSTIGVYHFQVQSAKSSVDSKNAPKESPWRMALRVAVNAEGPQQGRPAPETYPNSSPPVSIELPQECCYYLLDDFNHHHQHAVLAGDCHRFASTHRVSRTEGHSFAYIHQRCTALLGEKLKADKASIRRTLLLAAEVEFEWIRQYYIQGPKHHELHSWWHTPMNTLLAHLEAIEQRIRKQHSALVLSKTIGTTRGKAVPNRSDGGEERQSKQQKKLEALATTVTSDAFAEMSSLLEDRWQKRQQWAQRERDPIFSDLPTDLRPMHVPLDSVYAIWSEEGSKPVSQGDIHHNLMEAIRC